MPIAAVATGIRATSPAVKKGAASSSSDTQPPMGSAQLIDSQRRRLNQSRRAGPRRSGVMGAIALSATMNMPSAGRPNTEASERGGGANVTASRSATGLQMSEQTRSRMTNSAGADAPGASRALTPFQNTEEEDLKKRDIRENTIEHTLQASNLVLGAVDLSTAGLGLIATMGPHMLALARWNAQLFWGDIVGQGKNKYIGGLEYRGGLSVLKYVDKGTFFFKAFVLILDLLFVLAILVQFFFMIIFLMAALSPLLFGSYLLGSLLDNF